MKFIFEPLVYLMTKQQCDDKEIERFLADENITNWSTDATSSAEKTVEMGGRICYMSFSKPRPGGNSEYIKHIKEVGHGSVTEHTSWTFIITGVSRSLTHELVRHRVGTSFSQLSQRYVDEEDCNMVVPPELQKEVKRYLESKKLLSHQIDKSLLDDPAWNNGRYWFLAVHNALWEYKKMTEYLFNKLVPQSYLELRLGECGSINLSIEDMMKKLPFEKRTELRKRARQTARSLLPNATESKIVVTFNARSLRNFLELRANIHAESEIRVLADKIYDIIVKESPSLFNDYIKKHLEDGSYELETEYRKI